MKRLVIAVLVCLSLTIQPGVAQESGRGTRDPISAQVLPPDLILKHQKAIGLTDAQRTAIIGEVKRVQGRLVDLQWALKGAVDRMVELLDAAKVDEAAAVAQLEQILAIERDIKQTQLVAAVRLKNQLTPEQQRKLKELQAAVQPR